ncbi:MAG: hypothetical protein QG657_4931 [Acidobacteriota bacterium]|nr:hypothetical protein [Acidobacteriota bacterium]
MKLSQTIGIIILVIIIGGAVGYKFFYVDKPVTHLKGLVGGEKMAFLENEKVRSILKKKYGLVVDYSKAGSIEMVKEAAGPDIDFLWPSSQVALELFKMTKSSQLLKDEIIFNSPIVLYSWDIVVDALIKAGMVRKVDEVYYIFDFPRLLDLIVDNKKWSDIGLDELFGKIIIISTDPSKSNSGNMFAGLVANIRNNGDVVDDGTIDTILPGIKNFFSRLGYMEHSSSDLFEQYLKTGVGAKPIIAGYENQIIEFSLQYRDLWPKIKEKMRILYPEPTVWSAHPLMILKPNAKELITALRDPEINKIAWESHGFRTGMLGVQNDPKVLQVVGIPGNIIKIIPMPGPQVMDKIIRGIQGN